MLPRSKIADYVWSTKYKVSTDNTILDTFSRVAVALSEGECGKSQENNFYRIMSDGLFFPAGRIMAGAGLNNRKVTLLNCYVSNTIDDSMEGIFEAVKQAAITQKFGGGIGFDFSTLRPMNAEVVGAASPASGPVSFMHVFNSMCKTIMSAGERRGAMMAMLNVSHPDIFQFIKSKGSIDLFNSIKDENLKRSLYQQFGSLQNFNISVAITNDFMTAVKNDTNWDLQFNQTVYKTVKARDLWNEIMKQTYEHSEPGIVFIDRINNQHNLNYMEYISATNPCGEEPLAPNDSCNLGAINLSKFVKKPFESDASINYDLLAYTISIAVMMLDCVRDITKYPNKEQEEVGNLTRRIGLGVMGLGSFLQQLGIKYNSQHGKEISNQTMRFIANEAYINSSILAKQYGTFKAFEYDKFNEYFISSLEESVKKHIKKYGLRNGTLLTVAPTGTTALAFGDNCTSGIEPTFLLNYTRKIRKSNTEEYEDFEVADYGARLYNQMFPNNHLPDYITDCTSDKIKPHDHVNMQSAIQQYVDASISKTINMPAETTFEEMKDVYLQAYESNCKGCTTYRPSIIRGSILSKTEKPVEKQIKNKKYTREPVLNSKTYYIPEWPADGSTRYITISDRDGKPWEIFISTKSTSAMAETMAIARILSALFKRADDPSFLADALKEIYSMDGTWINGVLVQSLPAAYGMVIEAHINNELPAFSKGRSFKPTVSDGENKDIINSIGKGVVEYKSCPACNQPTLISLDGCKQCTSCGYSNCS